MSVEDIGQKLIPGVNHICDRCDRVIDVQKDFYAAFYRPHWSGERVVDEYICEWCVFSLPYKHGENAAEGLTTPITPQSTTQGCNQCPHCLLKNGITVECPNCQEAIIQI